MKGQRLVLALVGGLLVAFLVTPIVALFTSATVSEVAAGFRHPLVWPALRLSLTTTSISLLVVVAFGTPLAWTLARRRGRLWQALESAIQLPIVIPPAVAGVALLLAFGRSGPIGSLLAGAGWSVTFSTTAVVMAEVFVSAPFFVQAATSAFRRVDPKLVLVSRTFGASPLRVFFRIALPLAAPGLGAAAAMAWARALGEFGATLMFAGNMPGTTQTLPLAIYTALEADLRAAQAISIALVVVAFCLLWLVRVTLRGSLEVA
ncbi:MAG: molybdate ABC transporter permease subunit [Myxococcales bacterium]|nr:molybdate ABC transporter permease subunit [Myxococcales bacterium]